MPAGGVIKTVAVSAACLALASAAFAQYPPAPPAPAQPEGQPAASVNANGNAFTGGLSFTPFSVTVPVGGVVRWTNTDMLVPHTATEDHGL
jgi:plastocyanin